MGNACMSWHYLAEREEASWEGSSLAGAPSVLSSLIPIAAAYCYHDSGTGFSLASRSGMTCVPSTGAPGADMSTLLAEVFHARTSVAQAPEQGLPAPVPGSGENSLASSERFDRRTSSLKTLRTFVLADLSPSCKILPAWGLMRAGVCSEPTMLEHVRRESACGLWPTPRATDADRGGRGDLLQAVRGNQNSHFRMWPTPRSERAGRTIRLYPGHVSASAHRRQSNGGHGDLEEEMAREDPKSVGGTLNPEWVEWLMGWPLGWSDTKQLPTGKFQQWLHWHGRR
jgi:hypothetical protein